LASYKKRVIMRNSYIASLNTDAMNTTAEIRTHLRIATTDEDTYLDSLALAAKYTIENYCNIIIGDTAIIQYATSWCDTTELYHSPVKNSGEATITKIRYYDSSNTLILESLTDYKFDEYSSPLRLGLTPGYSYPAIANRLKAIEISYSVGYDNATSAPESLKQAALILCGNWYENRQEIIVGRSVGSIPMTARYLMNPYRVETLGLLC